MQQEMMISHSSTPQGHKIEIEHNPPRVKNKKGSKCRVGRRTGLYHRENQVSRTILIDKSSSTELRAHGYLGRPWACHQQEKHLHMNAFIVVLPPDHVVVAYSNRFPLPTPIYFCFPLFEHWGGGAPFCILSRLGVDPAAHAFAFFWSESSCD